MNTWRTGLTLLSAATLAACFAAKDEPPPPVPPTKLELHIEATPELNPNPQGKASPVLLRIYELKGLGSFNSADYFSLYEKDQATLGPDLGRKQEMMVRPGEKKTVPLQPEDSTGFLAVFAGFRSLNGALWKGSVPITPHANNVVDIKLNASQMQMAAQPIQTQDKPEDKAEK